MSSSDDVFGGSELSGLTATPASPSRSQVHAQNYFQCFSFPTLHVQENSTEEPEPEPFEPKVSELPQDPTLATEEPAQTPTPVDDILSPHLDTPSPIEIEVDEGMNVGDEETKEPRIVAEEPSEVITPSKPMSTLVPSTPEVEHEVDQEDVHSVPIDDREETQEEEVEVAMEVVEDETVIEIEEAAEETEEKHEEEHEKEESSAESPGEVPDAVESREVTAEPTTVPEDVPEAQESSPVSPAVPEVEAELAVDDGESSGEEPLHVSRRK